MRKTIKRETLIQIANRQLALDETAFPRCNREYRQSIINLIGSVLHESGCYRGFNYLSREQLANPDNTPGINTLPGTSFLPESRDDRFKDTDDSRVFFI
jgi:hypothetical protein